MQQLDDDSHESAPVLTALEGDDCTHCEPGTLELDTYKGDDAVVCASCGVPGARLL